MQLTDVLKGGLKMTLDEAIKCAEKLAKEFKLDIEISITKYAKENLSRLADENEQLASWLRELKERREDALQTTKRGKWISKVNMDYVDKNKIEHHHGMCSECELIYDFVDLAKWFDFCPKCGADMRETIKG